MIFHRMIRSTDLYKVLGLTKTATKQEIKAAFRRLAVQYHPDKHSQSPTSVRDAATLRFKQISDAYDTLLDDRRRADYNIRSSSTSSSYSNDTNQRDYHGHNQYYSHRSSNYQSRNYNYQGQANFSSMMLRFLTTTDFLRSLAFAGVLVGGAVVIERSRDALWKMRNSGKSLEEALEAIEKAKANKDERGQV